MTLILAAAAEAAGGGIAEQFGITVEDLMAVNEITDPRQLQIGQALTIPNAPPTRTPSS